MTRTSLFLTLTLAIVGCHHHGQDDCYGNGRRKGT
jgi:hypothetical protein